ncbi:MAG: Ig-like domain-containing protein [Bacteroidetes bacterium]|nr:Ig-like domain-containing protein [Bacteroidota bacterium]
MPNNYSVKNSLIKFVIFFIPFLLFSCTPDSTVVTTGGGGGITPVLQKSTVAGQVIDDLSGIPIDSADVLISGPSLSINLKTDTQGKFATEIETDVDITLTIFTSKSGFVTDTATATVVPSTTLNLDLIKLSPITTGTPPSGDPVSIFLSSQSTTSIGVRASGSVETASLIFEVRDSSNTPIDLAHSVNVKFTLLAAPGGGEIISPSSVTTNNLGQATVNITSGTKAGVVQIRAQIDLASVTIISDPVSVAIHGGLPDLSHFSVIPSLVNFPALDQFGTIMTVSVSVGDKYSNPVKTGTVVSFITTGGIIEGSIATNDQGGGTVNLISGNPKPVDAILGPGFATVTATTVDENHVTISRDAIILFSGIPTISISPSTFAIANGGSQNFTYTVFDENGNPLGKGTQITVTVDGTSVSAQGQINVELPDTQSPVWTQFSFTVFDTDDSTNVVKPVSITINSTGPNGISESIISGTSR